MNENTMMFQALDDGELINTEGGGLVLGVVIVACIVAAGVGAYNGYKDTKDQQK